MIFGMELDTIEHILGVWHIGGIVESGTLICRIRLNVVVKLVIGT